MSQCSRGQKLQGYIVLFPTVVQWTLEKTLILSYCQLHSYHLNKSMPSTPIFMKIMEDNKDISKNRNWRNTESQNCMTVLKINKTYEITLRNDKNSQM